MVVSELGLCVAQLPAGESLRALLHLGQKFDHGVELLALEDF